MLGNWTLLVVSLLVAGGAAVASAVANRKRGAATRNAKSEVRRRCLMNPVTDIGLTLKDLGLGGNCQPIAESLLRQFASVMEVPAEMLTINTPLSSLCGVHFPSEEVPGGFMIAFADEILDFITGALTEDEWLVFLKRMDIPPLSEERTLQGIFAHSLGEVIGCMTDAKVRLKGDL